MTGTTKAVVAVGSILIVALLAFALFPVVYGLAMGPGIKTEGINADKTSPATVDVDGEWEVTTQPGPNVTSAGFTFNEVLPAEYKETSGSTGTVAGTVEVSGGKATKGQAIVDMTNIVTDRDVRDVNVRQKILLTNEYPEASFVLTKPADVSHLPDDGSVATVELTGDLTILDTTKTITQEFEAVRDGKNLVVAGDIPINRKQFGVETPEFVAATIAEEGEVNVRLNLVKKS
ncbi:YceI family protein [Corynebacterium breve]|uniref:YceI family protein n=1 Tax=Corynebacterium breve TaxID=3049799 RepID=A0ABY8VK36_9CORY|nr:YceI family protein [Corynebacterium breve]WIM69023.1 YceI family protein [Corynebacterium breve]